MSPSNPKDSLQHTYFEISDATLKVQVGERSEIFPLERCAEGRLTEECIADLRQRLAPYSGAALCALPGRGVSVRRFEIPDAAPAQLRQILSLKLEQEFPLPPEQFAWGFEVSRGPVANDSSGKESSKDGSRNGTSQNGVTLRSEAASSSVDSPAHATVLALRSDAVREYDQVFEGSGIRADYCLGILNTAQRLSRESGCIAVIDIGRHSSEALILDSGQPLQLRTFFWGGQDATRAVAAALDLDVNEAEQRKCQGGESIPSATRQSVQQFGSQLRGFLTSRPTMGESVAPLSPSRVFIAGGGAQLPQLIDVLSDELEVPCERLPQRDTQQQRPRPTHSILLQRDVVARTTERRSAQVRWVPWCLLLVVLFVTALALRYVPPLIRTPQLQSRIDSAKEQLAALPSVDSELAFLDYVNSHQLGALDALRIIADSAPKGTRLADISITNSGAVTFSGQVAKVDAINQLRQKMSASGWFQGAPVIASQERVKRKWKFRIVGQLAPFGMRPKPPAPAPKPGAAEKPSDANAKPSDATANPTNKTARPSATEPKPKTDPSPTQEKSVSKNSDAADPKLTPATPGGVSPIVIQEIPPSAFNTEPNPQQPEPSLKGPADAPTQ